MTVSKKSIAPESLDDDDEIPELTDEFFEKANVYVGGKLVSRGRGGRPPLANPKKQVTMRLDADVLDRLKADGPGWQSRANKALRKAVGL